MRIVSAAGRVAATSNKGRGVSIAVSVLACSGAESGSRPTVIRYTEDPCRYRIEYPVHPVRRPGFMRSMPSRTSSPRSDSRFRRYLQPAEPVYQVQEPRHVRCSMAYTTDDRQSVGLEKSASDRVDVGARGSIK